MVLIKVMKNFGVEKRRMKRVVEKGKVYVI